MPTVKKCYLFDHNGTLRDDLEAVFNSMRDVFLESDKEAPAMEEYRNQRASDFWTFYREHGFGDSERPLIAKRFSEIFHSKYESLVKPFPDALPALRALSQRGAVIGVVSNYRRRVVEAHLRNYGILGYVDVIVGQEDSDEQKPSPKPLLIAFQMLGISPKEGCYTGDSNWDIESAHAVGAFSIAISRAGSHHSREMLAKAKPDRIIQSLEELLDY